MKNNKQSGVALVTVLLVAAVTIALAYGALTVSLNTLQGSKAAESSVQARLNAESGLDAVLARLEFRAAQGHFSQSEDIIKDISDGILIVAGSGQTPFDYQVMKGQENDDIFTAHVHGRDKLKDTMYAVEASFEFIFPGTGSGNQEPGSDLARLFPIQTAAVTASGQVVLSGSGTVIGDVYSKETITLKAGGGKVVGNVVSLGSPTTTCNGPLAGNPGGLYKGVVFQDSTKVEGSVYSACHIAFKNWSATVSGNATAEGEIIPVSRERAIRGHIPNYNPSNPVMPLVTSFEDPLDIDDFVSLFEAATRNPTSLSISGSGDWIIDATTGTGVSVQSPSGLESFYGSSVSAIGKTHQVIRVAAFEMNRGSNTLRIRGDVVIFSDSTAKFLGGGKIVIDENSSLTIISKSDVEFGIEVSSNKADQLLVYSATTGEIKSSGYQPISVGIYAPKADIKVSGSGSFTGALYGNYIEISGSGQVTLDPILISLMTSDSSMSPVNVIIRR